MYLQKGGISDILSYGWYSKETVPLINNSIQEFYSGIYSRKTHRSLSGVLMRKKGSKRFWISDPDRCLALRTGIS